MADDLTPTGLPKIKGMRKQAFPLSPAERAAIEGENSAYWQGSAEVLGVVDENGQPVDPMKGSQYGGAFVDRGRPEPRFSGGSVNPYTGRELGQTSIFGGAGSVSDSFATPSDAAIRVRNPFMERAMSPMQQRVAAAEIGAIQRTKTRMSANDIRQQMGAEFVNYEKFMNDPTRTNAQKDAVDQQFRDDIERRSRADVKDLYDVFEAEESPEVALAKQKEMFRSVWGSRFKDEDFGELMASMGEIDPKTGKPSFSQALPFIAAREKEYQETRKEMAESRKTKSSALKSLSDLALDASEDQSIEKSRAYYQAVQDFEDEYGNQSSTPPARVDGEVVNLAEELKYLSSGRKKSKLPRSPEGFVEVQDQADLEAAQAEADRTGNSLQVRMGGRIGVVTPTGGEF